MKHPSRFDRLPPSASAIDHFINPPLALPVSRLGELFPHSDKSPPHASTKAFTEWKMEQDDAPILQYLYKAHRPQRHLEFGTWQGWGTTLCLESCEATVWTINLPEGETRTDGAWAYGERVPVSATVPPHTVAEQFGEDEQGPVIYHRTDAAGYIGRIYVEKGLGNRVCQIYCDSREWDISNYPRDFFDSVLIDGGHQADVVVNDSRKALQVLRSGGLVLWHDFCPDAEIRSRLATVNGVTSAIEQILPELQAQLTTLCWIDPSWILLGIRK